VKITEEKAVFESTIVENDFGFPLFEMGIWSNVTPMQAPEYAALRSLDGGAVEYQGRGGKMKFTRRKSAVGGEEMEVAGRKSKCHWIKMDDQDESAIPSMNDKRSTKTWYFSEIPGGVAKVEMTRLISGGPPQSLVVNRIVKG
jgi:hypothetical protein